VVRSKEEKLARWVKRQGGNWTIILTVDMAGSKGMHLARGKVDRINAGLKSWNKVGQFKASYRSTPEGYVVLAKWLGDWPEGQEPEPANFVVERTLKRADDEEG
jgi:hypothetical protein